jgi:DinB superfamily
MVNAGPPGTTPVHDDLVEMLAATREVEHDLFAAMTPELRDAPRRIGEWSARDVLAHLAAWRSVEARRLAGEPDGTSTDESEDDANARIQAERAAWSWERVCAEADASIDALMAGIVSTSEEDLARSERLVAGIGGNGVNHAIAHLADVAALPGRADRFAAFARQVEAILLRGRIGQRDAAVMLYNIACHHALAGELDDARRLLLDAFAARAELLDWALTDVDLAALRDELPALAGG